MTNQNCCLHFTNLHNFHQYYFLLKVVLMVNASTMYLVVKSISMKSVNKSWVMPIYTLCLKVSSLAQFILDWDWYQFIYLQFTHLAVEGSTSTELSVFYFSRIESFNLNTFVCGKCFGKWCWPIYNQKLF